MRQGKGRSGEVERVKVGCATGGMHDQIGSHRLGLAVGGTVHKEAVRHFLDPLHRRPRTHVDAEFAKFLHEPADQIWVEGREHPLGALEHGDVGAGSRREVREFRGNVSAADHGDTRGQRIEFEKAVAGHDVAEGHRTRAGRDQNVTGFEFLASTAIASAPVNRVSPWKASMPFAA